MDITSVAFVATQIGTTFGLAPFDTLLQPLIDETLAEQEKTVGVAARCWFPACSSGSCWF